MSYTLFEMVKKKRKRAHPKLLLAAYYFVQNETEDLNDDEDSEETEGPEVETWTNTVLQIQIIAMVFPRRT